MEGHYGVLFLTACEIHSAKVLSLLLSDLVCVVMKDMTPPLVMEFVYLSKQTCDERSAPYWTGEFMLARYREVVEIVLHFRESKEKLIRRAVISLIPRLAAFAPERFAATYLSTCTDYLINIVKCVPQILTILPNGNLLWQASRVGGLHVAI